MVMQDNSANSTEFTVSYEGDALSDHLMDAQDLGAALVALGKLFDRANFLLNGGRISVKLDVRATQSGSFEIVLYTAQIFHIVAPFLTPEMFKSALDITGFLVGADSLITSLKRLKGNRPEAVSGESSSDRVTLEIEDLHTESMSLGYLRLDTPAGVWKLAQDKDIIDAISGAVKPASREGIERVSFRQGIQELESVSKDEVPYFQLPDGTKTEEIIIPKQELELVTVYLGSGRGKWRLRDHTSTKSYAMMDEQFRGDVADRIRFGAGDILVCDVKVKSTLNNRQEYEILKVVEHRIKTKGEQSSF